MKLTPDQTALLVPSGVTLIPGKMYLRLYHGRNDPDQEMDDWGFVGPIFGPLSCYVQTYCLTFRMHGEHNTDEVWLQVHEDLLVWRESYYGDMEVFVAGPTDKA